MKKLNLLLSMVFLYAIANAQQIESEERPLTQDIGFNTTFVFQGLMNSSPSDFSLMYKSYRDQTHATRLGLDINFYINDADGTTTGTYQTYSSGSVSIVVGKEKINPLGKRWLWIYGGDLVPFYNQTKNTSFSTQGKYYSFDSKEYGMRVRPFLGIRFAINERLYASAEASISLSYSRTGQLSKTYDPEVTTLDTEGTRIGLSVNPASGIFIYYRF